MTETHAAPRLTFARLSEMEPLLLALERAVDARTAANRRRRNWCANAAWYGYGAFADAPSFRRHLPHVVGWHRAPAPAHPHDAVLRSEEAYCVAYAHLYERLPDCRTCGCL